jgi:hypothetical protein
MGYTHYWYQKKDFTVDQWKNIQKGFLDVLFKHCERSTPSKKQITIAYEYDSPMEQQPTLFGGPKWAPKDPEVNGETIRFNGWGDEGHETFHMTRKKPEPTFISSDSFGFCKTARKPYDIAVCLTLLLCKHHAPEAITVESDGSWEKDWMEARKVFKKLFSFEAHFPFEKEEAAL